MRTPRRRLRAVALLLTLPLASAGVAWTASDPLGLTRSAAYLRAAIDGADFVSASDVIRQVSFHDCGPAALANYLQALDVNVFPAVDSIAALAGTTPGGTRLRGLADAAHHLLGFSPRTGKLDPQRVGPDKLPIIAWFDRGHFVVLEGQSADGRFTIIDPLIGRYVLSRHAVARRWTGEALWASPRHARDEGSSVGADQQTHPIHVGGKA